jgi:hypothetical protein
MRATATMRSVKEREAPYADKYSAEEEDHEGLRKSALAELATIILLVAGIGPLAVTSSRKLHIPPPKRVCQFRAEPPKRRIGEPLSLEESPMC